MGGFKRFCMVVFALAGLLGMAALALTWFGPWTKAMSALLAIDAYYIAVEVCLAITLVGLLACLLVGLLSRRRAVVEIGTVDGGRITVTHEAIASQAAHIVESDGSCVAEHVDVSARRRGDVRVHVRVLPHSTVDVVGKGAQLHADLTSGLAAVCGDRLRGVSLEFVEPEAVTIPEAVVPAAGSVAPSAGLPAAHDGEDVPDEPPSDPLGSTSEITVPMGAAREPGASERQEA